MAQLAPPLGEKLVEQVVAAMPAYRDLAAERAVKAWPAFSARVATEAESFAGDTEAMVRARSQQALERVAGRLSDDLKRDFPGLTPKRLEALTRRLHDVLLAEGVGLGTEVEAIIAREADRIATMLGRLPVEETAEQPETRLQKGSSGISVARVDRIRGLGGVDCRDGNTLFALRPFARPR